MNTPSDTPLTDALDAELGVTDARAGDSGRYRKLARTLEREVNRLKKELEEAENEAEGWRDAFLHPDD